MTAQVLAAQESILKNLAQRGNDARVTQNDLCRETSLTRDQVRYAIKKLKQYNILKLTIGSKKQGYVYNFVDERDKLSHEFLSKSKTNQHYPSIFSENLMGKFPIKIQNQINLMGKFPIKIQNQINLMGKFPIKNPENLMFWRPDDYLLSLHNQLDSIGEAGYTPEQSSCTQGFNGEKAEKEVYKYIYKYNNKYNINNNIYIPSSLKKEKINKKEKKVSSPNPNRTDELFAMFWKRFDSNIKGSKQAAQAAFAKLKPTLELTQQLINAYVAQKRYKQLRQSYGLWSPEFAHVSTWLNKRRYEDELATDEQLRAEAASRTRQRTTTAQDITSQQASNVPMFNPKKPSPTAGAMDDDEYWRMMRDRYGVEKPVLTAKKGGNSEH